MDTNSLPKRSDLRYSVPPRRKTTSEEQPALSTETLDKATVSDKGVALGSALAAFGVAAATFGPQAAQAAEQVIEAPMELERSFRMPETLQTGRRYSAALKTNGHSQRLVSDSDGWSVGLPSSNNEAQYRNETFARARWLNVNEPMFQEARTSIADLDNTSRDLDPTPGVVSVKSNLPYERVAEESFDGQRYELKLSSPRRLGRVGQTLDYSHEKGESHWRLSTETKSDPTLKVIEDVHLAPNGEGQHDYRYRSTYLKTGGPPLVNPIEVPVNVIILD